MIGAISQSALFSFAHRRDRLRDDLALARRAARERPEDEAVKAEIAGLQAKLDILAADARACGVRIPSMARRYDPFS